MVGLSVKNCTSIHYSEAAAMLITSRDRISPILLIAFLLVMLSGCHWRYFGREKNVPAPESVEVTVPAGKANPAVGEIPAEKPAVEGAQPEPPSSAEGRPLSRQLKPQGPEGAMV